MADGGLSEKRKRPERPGGETVASATTCPTLFIAKKASSKLLNVPPPGVGSPLEAIVLSVPPAGDKNKPVVAVEDCAQKDASPLSLSVRGTATNTSALRSGSGSPARIMSLSASLNIPPAPGNMPAPNITWPTLLISGNDACENFGSRMTASPSPAIRPILPPGDK